MREIIEISVNDARPEEGDVLRLQGIPPGKRPPKEADKLFQGAVDVFLGLCRPRGIISELSTSEFAEIYRGEGLNEKRTPLDEIFKDADHLALFAVTLGQEVTDKINELFEKNEFALGSMLDSAASVGSEKAAEMLQNHHLRLLSDRGKVTSDKAAMRFSPGYCGWHMSGQKKLFEFLRPEEIGIRLLDSFLMKPLKSISGVIVVGDKNIFASEDSYPFCSECKTRSCRDRMNAVFGESRPNNKKGVM
jgi:hypothetical protein